MTVNATFCSLQVLWDSFPTFPHTLTFIHLIQHFRWDTRAAKFRMSSINHSVIFWRIYEVTLVGPVVDTLWCFTIREIDPADVGVLRAGTAFLLPPPVSSLFSSPLPFLPRNEWATWGWWPVTDREETRLSTLSDSQSEWLTVEQVTPLGIDSHSWASFPVICFRYLSYCHNSNNMHYRQGIK